MTNITLSLTLVATENTTFDDAPEVEVMLILTEFAARVLDGCTGDFPLRDSKGNRIGYASLLIQKYEASE